MTKTSAHIQRIERWMQQALVDLDTSWVKIVNAPPGPDPMPRIPNKLVRMHTDDIDAQFVPRGEVGGRDFVRHMLPIWQQRPYATCYSLACGPNCDELADLRVLCGYFMGALREIQPTGLKLVIGDFFESHPTGGKVYDPAVKRAKLQELLPAVQLACDLGHYVGSQAYYRPGVEGPLGRFHALGEVIVKVQMWQEMGLNLDNLRYFVMEWGLDGALESHPYEGWQVFVARGETSDQEYIQNLLKAEALAQLYPWLLALFLFTYGWEKPWQTYDHNESFTRRLVAAMPNLPVAVEPIIPVEPVKPEPTYGLTDDDIRNLACNALGIPYTATHAFWVYARRHNLGAALFTTFDSQGERIQPFTGGIVRCKLAPNPDETDWGNTTHIRW